MDAASLKALKRGDLQRLAKVGETARSYVQLMTECGPSGLWN